MTDDLIRRLESATEGSRELSDECLLAVGWRWYDGFRVDMIKPDEEGTIINGGHLPDLTRNIQHAIDWMVPEGYHWHVSDNGGADVGPPRWKDSEGKGATPALGLCIAALKAREGESG